MVYSDFINPCSGSAWEVGCARLTAVFQPFSGRVLCTLCLSFVLYSPVAYTENEDAVDFQIMLVSWEGNGALWGVEGLLPKAIMALLLVGPSKHFSRMGSHFSRDYLPF